MTRFNYQVSRAERWFGAGMMPSLPVGLRLPAATLAVALGAVAALGVVQAGRLQAAQRDADVLDGLIAQQAPALARMQTLARALERARVGVQRLAEVRRSGARRADTMAELGNRLPADAWLTAVRIDQGAIAIEGRGARLGAVAIAMSALAAAHGAAGARLLKVRDEPARATVSYSLALELRR